MVRSIRSVLVNWRFPLILVILCLLTFFELHSLAVNSGMHQAEYNLYDLFLYMQDYWRIVFAIAIPFLFLIGILTLDREQDGLAIYRCRNRWEWFGSKVLSILLISLIYVASIFLLVLFIGVASLARGNEWSEATILVSSDLEKSDLFGNVVHPAMVHVLTPLEAVVISTLLLWLLLSSLGLISLTVNVVTKRKVFGFLATIALIVIMIFIHREEWESLFHWSLFTNAILNQHDFGQDEMRPTLFYSFIYFPIFIGFVTALGYLLFLRVDISFEERSL